MFGNQGPGLHIAVFCATSLPPFRGPQGLFYPTLASVLVLGPQGRESRLSHLGLCWPKQQAPVSRFNEESPSQEGWGRGFMEALGQMA